ncbi:MAG: 30S ribosome-binding factor RbfA [Anaerolineales bacterium]|nr:30S ribosome-binding factor RbfA [Anaerolineales bacterium]MCW5855240.1 30S ribosome-binding factor RbfA [Anaerolineales bacterium]
MVSQSRAARIAKGIQEMLAEMLLFEVTDPRLQGVFITDVRVDRELSQANVFVSALEGVERSQEILAGLQHASGFLRTQLARRSDLRVFPRLRFVWDPTPENAERIESLIATLNKDSDTDKNG